MRVPSPIAGEYSRLGRAVREKRMTVEQALKEMAQICVDRHEHFGLMLMPIAARDETIEECARAAEERWRGERDRIVQNGLSHGCIAAAEVIRALKTQQSIAALDEQGEKK